LASEQEMLFGFLWVFFGGGSGGLICFFGLFGFLGFFFLIES